jgi:dihydropteroate synthase
MHIQGSPQTMQEKPIYKNVTNEVISFFRKSLDDLQRLGVTKIILDPGFGFGKTVEHNYQLLNELDKIASLNAPLLVGFSRKSMITKPLGISSKDALNGTSILNTIALTKGCKIIRVHDVKEAKEAVTLFTALKK